jgi:hypothetical protein
MNRSFRENYNMSSTEIKISQQQKKDKLARFRRSLSTSRALQETKLAVREEGIEEYVKDVEGDWLDRS